MSKHDFTFDEFRQRRRRVAEALEAAQLDWLLVFHPVSIHWLTGSDAKSYQEFQCLFVPSDVERLVILARDGERDELETDAYVDDVRAWGGGRVEDPLDSFERVARSLGVFGTRVGMEAPAYYLHPHHYVGIRRLLGESLVAEPTNLIADLKLVKSPAELTYIRAAARIADEGMQVFAESLAAGRTELSLAGDVYRTLLAAGSGLAASPMNLVSGERSCYSHGAPTERVLRPGDFGSIEYGATYRRYTSTIGRNFCLGEPTARMRELHDIVRRASDACIAEIRAGVPATTPHDAARRVIVEAGVEHGRVHTSGYGLAPGFPPTWGEPLHMLDQSTYSLQAGMVLTVEPPVFLGAERLGARLIDNVLVTDTGAEVLSTFSRDLIER